MADYYPLIARAVEGLDNNTGENRRALYERARTALVNQLRTVDPPLDEAEITSERLALEESIRQIEADAVKREHAQAAPSPEQNPPEDTPPSMRDQALRDFRGVMAEVEGLGDAAAEANRSARSTYEQVPGDRPPPPRAPNQNHERPPHPFEPQAYEPKAAPPPPPFRDKPAPRAAQKPPQKTQKPVDQPPPASWPPPPSEQFEDEDEAYARPPRNYGRFITIAVVVLALIGIAGAGYWQRGAIMNMVAGLRSSAPAPKPPQQAQQPSGTPKIADRIGPSSDGGTPATANAPAAQVAQKVVLYDEDPNDPQGKRYVGSAIWRTETVSPGPGLAPELAIRADVEIPERRMRMTWSLRRNTDKALPASHTIEIMFTLPADFDQGGIGNVPGVLMKQNEQARGVPLAGLAVKVTNGYFLIGLSAVDTDLQRNLQLLKERDWFDIPIVYTSGKRAILAVEKGTPGARAFEEAFRAWGQ
ncbi:MAG TPA: hypothetical protein VHT93_13985 [Pseudolabrys sp.]|jgi:hypothetical protein|nr:hypothetical protein [Pseudolabrys sp.]